MAKRSLYAMGFIVTGIGEWKNHGTVSWIKPLNACAGGAALMSGKVRQHDGFGRRFEIPGVSLMRNAIFNIIVK